jgi:hypothetical protein
LLVSSTALFAGRCVRVFVLLELVFEFSDSVVLVSELLTKKRVLSSQGEILLAKGRSIR